MQRFWNELISKVKYRKFLVSKRPVKLMRNLFEVIHYTYAWYEKVVWKILYFIMQNKVSYYKYTLIKWFDLNYKYMALYHARRPIFELPLAPPSPTVRPELKPWPPTLIPWLTPTWGLPFLSLVTFKFPKGMGTSMPKN